MLTAESHRSPSQCVQSKQCSVLQLEKAARLYYLRGAAHRTANHPATAAQHHQQPAQRRRRFQCETQQLRVAGAQTQRQAAARQQNNA